MVQPEFRSTQILTLLVLLLQEDLAVHLCGDGRGDRPGDPGGVKSRSLSGAGPPGPRGRVDILVMPKEIDVRELGSGPPAYIGCPNPFGGGQMRAGQSCRVVASYAAEAGAST